MLTLAKRAAQEILEETVVEENPLPDKTVDAIFDQFWPMLEKKLKAFPDAPKEVEKRTLDDMVEEMLDILRSQVATRADIQALQASTSASGYNALYGIPGASPVFGGTLKTLAELAGTKELPGNASFSIAEKYGLGPSKRTKT